MKKDKFKKLAKSMSMALSVPRGVALQAQEQQKWCEHIGAGAIEEKESAIDFARRIALTTELCHTESLEIVAKVGHNIALGGESLDRFKTWFFEKYKQLMTNWGFLPVRSMFKNDFAEFIWFKYREENRI